MFFVHWAPPLDIRRVKFWVVQEETIIRLEIILERQKKWNRILARSKDTHEIAGTFDLLCQSRCISDLLFIWHSDQMSWAQLSFHFSKEQSLLYNTGASCCSIQRHSGAFRNPSSTSYWSVRTHADALSCQQSGLNLSPKPSLGSRLKSFSFIKPKLKRLRTHVWQEEWPGL